MVHMNPPTKQTHRQDRRAAARGEEAGRTGGMGFAGTTVMCRMDTPQGPTRNYTQCPVINHNGKRYFKKIVYMCSVSHFALQQTQD